MVEPRLRVLVAIALMLTAAGCGGSPARPTDGGTSNDGGGVGDAGASTGADGGPGPGRGFPALQPWVSFYGTAAQLGDLDRVARTFRIINIDADPDAANFTRAQLATLRAGGQNRVISYFNLGACETYRSYWRTAPAGLVPCERNTAAQRGLYEGYPDETWMDLGNADYQRLLVEHVAPRLVAQGIDGFFFDNLEIVEHGTATTNGPCDAACAQGGLDLVRRLRERYPALLFVMQNATSTTTLEGTTGGVSYPTLLDGISHEQVFAPAADAQAQSELSSWRAAELRPGGRAFFIGTEDYVGTCDAVAQARAAYEASRGLGFSPYATDASAGQRVACYWPF